MPAETSSRHKAAAVWSHSAFSMEGQRPGTLTFLSAATPSKGLTELSKCWAHSQAEHHQVKPGHKAKLEFRHTVWDKLTFKMIHCVSQIQMELGILYASADSGIPTYMLPWWWAALFRPLVSTYSQTSTGPSSGPRNKGLWVMLNPFCVQLSILGPPAGFPSLYTLLTSPARGVPRCLCPGADSQVDGVNSQCHPLLNESATL